MTAVLVLTVAFAGWLVTTVSCARWIAQNVATCHTTNRDGSTDKYTWRSRGNCIGYHGEQCWQPHGEVTPWVICWAATGALSWPLLGPLALAYWLARRKPTPVGLQRRIAELEREAGIEPWPPT